MNFNIKKAVQRIGWRIKERHWKCNQNDLDAYNFIVDYVEKQNEMIQNANELFAKMYIHIYGQYLMSYGANPSSEIPKKVLSREVAKDINEHIQEFYDLTNEVNFIKKVDSKDLKELTIDDMKEFNYEFIERNLLEQINEVIQKHCEWKRLS